MGAYLLGSVPTAYVAVRMACGADIRELGSRNVGAFNTYKQVGPWGGIFVLLTDTAKGALAVAVPRLAGADDWTLFATTTLVVAGHNWPVFLNFRGGKGAAAIFGISLAVVPSLVLITLAVVALIVLVIRNVVLGVAFGFIMLDTLLLVTGQDAEQVVLCIFLTLVVTVTYLISSRDHVTNSIRDHRWKELFTGPA